MAYCSYGEFDGIQSMERYFFDGIAIDTIVLHATTKIMGGRYTQERFEEIKEKIHFHVFGLFDDCSTCKVMVEVPHSIICIAAPQGCFLDEDLKFIQNFFHLNGCAEDIRPLMSR